jgi:hypothetical protein
MKHDMKTQPMLFLLPSMLFIHSCRGEEESSRTSQGSNTDNDSTLVQPVDKSDVELKNLWPDPPPFQLLGVKLQGRTALQWENRTISI